MIRAVIFDFDGLIMDTELYEFYSFRDLLAEYGVELPLDLYRHRIGGHVNAFDPYAYVQRQTGQPLEREALRTRRRELFDALFRDEADRPGVEAYLQSAVSYGLMIGLASSAPKEWVLPLLNRLGLTGYFASIRTYEDAVRVKPDPELYVRVLDDFGIRPDEAIAFEDSPNGASAAVGAGIPCVIVPNKLTDSLTFPPVSQRLQSMEEMSLADVIARLLPLK